MGETAHSFAGVTVPTQTEELPRPDQVGADDRATMPTGAAAATLLASALLSGCPAGGYQAPSVVVPAAGGGAAPTQVPTPNPTPIPSTPVAPQPPPQPAPQPPTQPAPQPAPQPPTQPQPQPAPQPQPQAPLPTQAEASRFLAQAGFAASTEDIGIVSAIGYEKWLNQQFALPLSKPSAWSWIQTQAQGGPVGGGQIDATLWRRLISAPDQLRQRVVLALSEILVIAAGQLDGVSDQASMAAAYWDTLEQHAFGTFRQLLEAVTLSGAMGAFLNMRGSVKVNPKSGGQPDENYAREVVQLFCIGLVELNPDGSSVLDGNGQEIYTYTQEQVTAFAAALTGWNFDLASGTKQQDDPAFATRPMVNNPKQFSAGDKSVLGTVIPEALDGPAALAMALDVLCNHPNNGPFIGRQLIQRLVCSNPSPAYVSRVSAVFNNNGHGVRGDLRAVVTAVLLDPEARSPAAGPASGKLREPIVRFVQWARTFGMTSSDATWKIGNLTSSLGQSPLRAPSVFNFFEPDYVPSNSTLGDNDITAPEFQICTESTVVVYLNYMQSVIAAGVKSSTSLCAPDYSGELSYANDAAGLVARYNLLLAGGGLGADTLSLITSAVDNISVNAAKPEAGLKNRIWAAIFLIMAAPDYLIQR